MLPTRPVKRNLRRNAAIDSGRDFGYNRSVNRMARKAVRKSGTRAGTARTEKIIRELWTELPTIARGLIAEAWRHAEKRYRAFLESPDSAREHEPKWHQWGIITHTQMFQQHYERQVPRYLKRWGVSELVARKLARRIDGVSKSDLLRISIPLHDLGKFFVRLWRLDADTPSDVLKFKVKFSEHDKASGRIVRRPAFRRMLEARFGLTERQVEYIAKCTERHYEFGKMRDRAKESRLGFTLRFARSPSMLKECRRLLRENRGFQLEIALLFLADSLAKVAASPVIRTKRQIERELRRMRPNRTLPDALMQAPVHIAACERYLKLWAKMQTGKQ